jgi:hypothetical protein
VVRQRNGESFGPRQTIALGIVKKVPKMARGWGRGASYHAKCAAKSTTKQAADAGIIPNAVLKRPLADMIGALYQTNQFKDHRAALGGAREFVKDFRNVASHAPKTAKAAADKIRKCKTGFVDAIAIAIKLRAVMQAFGYKVHIYTT